MGDVDTPRLDPVPESAALPEEGMPSPDEAAGGLLDAAREEPIDVDRLASDLGLELPDDPSDATGVVLRSLVDSRQEAGEHLTMMQRIAADFENYRKRVERDHVENVTRASQRVVERLLPALDSFDAAIAYEAPSEGASKVLDGMRGTHAQLLEILADEGLEPIAAIGEPFDPAIHEAAAGPQGDGDGALVVAQELRRGYTMQGRVVRPSLVTVEHG